LGSSILFQLPCHSGVSLDRLEGDTATQQAIETLVDLSHDSLDIIAWALSELLERLAKVSKLRHILHLRLSYPQYSKPTPMGF
jgi:neurofibromin 1